MTRGETSALKALAAHLNSRNMPRLGVRVEGMGIKITTLRSLERRGLLVLSADAGTWTPKGGFGRIPKARTEFGWIATLTDAGAAALDDEVRS